MKKTVTTSSHELKVLKERVKKLAMEKSYNELVIGMMNRISASPGLENTVYALMQNIMEIIGGTRTSLYYLVGQQIYFADVYGKRETMLQIEDELVRQVFEIREGVEVEEAFVETKMKTTEFSKAYTWAYPLVVGPDLIGVMKMEHLHLGMRDLYKKLPTFFGYAALILKNEIQGHTRLQKINDALVYANSELAKQRTFLEAILENIADGIVACDENGLLSLFNRATREFHGIKQEHLPPEHWAAHYNLYRADGVTPMQRDDIPLYKAYMGVNVDNEEMVIAPKEGKHRFLLVSGRAMHDTSGRKIGAVVSMHDVTEWKKAEEKLKAAYEKLKGLDRMKSMFIASMSHELRTPLNSILGFTSIVMDGLSGEINDEQRSQLERVNRAGHRLLSMITDIIDISRIESGKVQSDPSNFSLQVLIDEAIESIQLEIQEAGLSLTKNMPGELKMYADDQRLFQCVLNLLKNAVKFTESGTISVTVSEENNMVSIAVSDTGIGIAAKDIDRLFKPFERIDTDFSLKVGGTGLGLYLTKKLVVETLQGKVEVESEEGKGSTFTIRVPKDCTLSEKQGGFDAA